MNKIILLLSLSTLCALSTHAQEGTYRYDDATQLWRETNNAAALGLDSTRNRGYALFNGEHWSGDYARVQEGTQTNQLRFQTERYQTVGKYLHAYGRFNFDYGRTKNRAWADVRRPYNANPYFAGSSISGKYDFQDFDFTAALGTTDFGGWRFGIRLDYSVGDLSRLRDPRSRSQLLDYRITPAITRSFGAHTIGLSGNYHRRKEKIANITTVQQDATLKYYQMTGMEHADGTTGGFSSFSREWLDHRFGTELSYAYHSQKLYSLLALSIEKGTESAYGQYKFEPGKYVDYTYGIGLRNRLKAGHIIHQLDLIFNYDQAYADEYRQQLVETKEAETGYTSYSYNTLITYKKRFQVKQFNADIHYRLHFVGNEQEKAYIGARLKNSKVKNKYLIPTSNLQYGGTCIMGEGGVAFGKSLWLDASVSRFTSRDVSMDLADPNTNYAKSVLLPDMDYYHANYWQGHLQLTYSFPLKVAALTHAKGKDSKPVFCFVRAYGDYLKTNSSLDAKCIGISIGVFN